MKGLTPRRGDMWLVDFNPGRGSEQKGARPALVIQNDTGNIYAATTIVAAVTSTNPAGRLRPNSPPSCRNAR